MKLMELFSPSAEMQEKDERLDPEINYLDDLKYFIDNEDSLLSKFFFPAISKQKKQADSEQSYKLYLDPVKKTVDIYCTKFKLEDLKDKIFDNDAVIKVAKRIADEQKNHIMKKEYGE
jgi:hypothetical protein